MKDKKRFQELNLSNAFMFALAMEDSEICRLVLERILEFPIREVVVRTELSMIMNPEFRGIRLDVYAEDDENTMFNIEMQTINQGDLPKRSRYHQSQMDVQSLRSGCRFRELKESYVIFICTFDPFGRGKYRYCFEEWCEKEELPLRDGTHKIFLNSKGNDSKDVPKELIWFLRYACNSTEEVVNASEDKLLRKLHEKVNGIKRDGEKEVQYMTVQDWMDDMFFEGKQEGKQEGKIEGQIEGQVEGKMQERQQMLALIAAMSQDGKVAEIPRLSAEEAFFLEMQKKYQLQ